MSPGAGAGAIAALERVRRASRDAARAALGEAATAWRERAAAAQRAARDVEAAELRCRRAAGPEAPSLGAAGLREEAAWLARRRQEHAALAAAAREAEERLTVARDRLTAAEREHRVVEGLLERSGLERRRRRDAAEDAVAAEEAAQRRR